MLKEELHQSGNLITEKIEEKVFNRISCLLNDIDSYMRSGQDRIISSHLNPKDHLNAHLIMEKMEKIQLIKQTIKEYQENNDKKRLILEQKALENNKRLELINSSIDIQQTVLDNDIFYFFILLFFPSSPFANILGH